MSNKEIARHFNLLGKIMELHGENPFKYRSYYKAYNTLRKVEASLANQSVDDLQEIEGVGKNIANKIVELSTTGEMQTLMKYQDLTPAGVQEMLLIRGFGPKKVKVIWEGLGIDNIGELLYACQENRLVALKGFGAKTQETLREQLEYYMESKGQYHLAAILPKAQNAIATLQVQYPHCLVLLTGDLRRSMNVATAIDLVTDLTVEQVVAADPTSFVLVGDRLTFDGYTLVLHVADTSNKGSVLAHTTGPASFVDALSDLAAEDETSVLAYSGMAYVLPELRDLPDAIDRATTNNLPGRMIEVSDIKGIVHNHSTYSDGIHSLREMAEYVQQSGFEYFVISDHSKYAAYANGLNEDRVAMQQREIDVLNVEMAPFKTFKSIECDILPDGQLDYDEETLASFDVIVASVHANLKMSQPKAMERLIRAIASPYTHILGHMTGRLLLSRQGYPVDHREIIDACAEYQVAIELNANPHRLDMDWEHIPYAIEKGVLISINPDAHSREAIHYIEWGVAAARKGGLEPQHCLNTKTLLDFGTWVDNLPSKAL